MKNIIEGYGDRYVIPTYSLLDSLAEDYSHTKAGEELKAARERTRSLIKNGKAALCDYAEENRKRTAIEFVLDAFNGKVDTIFSCVKQDNYGTLEQKIKDAFNTVNHNGSAFRNARISDTYFGSRMQELKMACTVQALKEREKEEQKLKYEGKLQELQQKLSEAEEKNKRALSMAQQTKAGHVYVISNIGSFGEDVIKIGLTRRF
jgi:transcription-repair coupling factor (superfamily II helicase)